MYELKVLKNCDFYGNSFRSDSELVKHEANHLLLAISNEDCLKIMTVIIIALNF